MLSVLRSVVANLHTPMLNRAAWGTLFIDYEKPHVERIWSSIKVDGDDYRVYLHKIHPCGRSEAFYHPHPWPSAILICYTPPKGGYETGIGFDNQDFVTTPPVMGPFFMEQWAAYQMTDPREWHYVRPIGGPILSIMITGKPFSAEKPSKLEKPKMRELIQAESDPLWEYFKNPSNRHKMLTVLDKWLENS